MKDEIGIQDMVREAEEKVLNFLKRQYELSQQNASISVQGILKKSRKTPLTRKLNKFLENTYNALE